MNVSCLPCLCGPLLSSSCSESLLTSGFVLLSLSCPGLSQLPLAFACLNEFCACFVLFILFHNTLQTLMLLVILHVVGMCCFMIGS